MNRAIRKISLISSLSLFAHSAFAADITLNIAGYKIDQGTTMISVYDDQASFDNEDGKALVSIMQRLIGESTVLTLHNMPTGDYAVKVFHDENGNDELDTNIIGIPTEQYGFSNNAGSFGPASFADAKFSVNDMININITLR